jgi:hypothetical protein
MTASLLQLLQEKQNEITEIVLQHPEVAYYYNDPGVRIFGCTDTYKSGEMPAADVLINFDERNEHDVDLIVCFRKHASLPTPPGYRKGGVAWCYVAVRLDELIGCITNVTDELGIKEYYPVTYSKTLSTHKWDCD